ncbi:MAG: Ig-like domain-containing protein [Acidobacteria bacterium]|nr:Ig-like domain-containing protein [Acidobacteriota bacterium]MBI3487006.1 Ig-like domain-containing protein [Acidobacteriota bacterium]
MRTPVLMPAAVLGALLACGGGKGSVSGNGTPPAPTAGVSLSPPGASLWTGGTQAFTATVTGHANPAVTWTVVETGGGSISAAGLYTAPASAGSFHVKATSVGDPSLSAQATLTVSVQPAAGACNGAALGAGASLQGFVPFPADNAWNQDISAAPVDPNSAAIIAFIGAGTGLHPDFGAGLYLGSPMGIPYMVVSSSAQPKVPVSFTLYGDESDPGPMPIPPTAPVEGGDGSTGDRHVLVMDRDTCLLYELGNGYRQSNNSWVASGAAVWDLKSNALRPYGWTSADAAGLPIFPGLARYDEVAAGAISHALRFTVPVSRKAYVLPATHQAGSSTSSSAPPMGLRVRLKAGVDISGYPAQARVVLAALKRYGMILADNGSPWYISGTPDDRWDNDQLARLSGIKGSDFEVVQMGTVYTSDPAGTAPTLSAFSAAPASIKAGASAQLTWTGANATRWFITPEVGWATGGSATVKPAATTTYTLTAQGPYGSVSRTVQVIVAP